MPTQAAQTPLGTLAGLDPVAAYAPTLPAPARRITWDEVLAELGQTPGLRPDTLVDYRKVINALREHLPDSKGPHDITPARAETLLKLYAQTPFTKSDKPGAKTYKRTNNTVRAALRKLSSLFGKHLKDHVRANPFGDVKPPPASKKLPTVPTDELVDEFMAYLWTRYPGWDLPRLYVQVKGLIASRTIDLCSLRADQVRDGRLYFDADQTKGRAGRSILLPPALFAELEAVKGKAWLWERYTTDVTTWRPSKNRPAPATYDPSSFRWTIANLFKEFNESRPGRPKLTPHDLRRRAITQMTVASQSVDATAQAIGVDPQTARRYYLDDQRAFNSDALFTKLAAAQGHTMTGAGHKMGRADW